MAAIPNLQEAWVVTRRGIPAKALSRKSDWPVPKKLEQGEVLIKVQAAALNPAGWKLMKWAPGFIVHRPHIAENDFSGVVVDANGTEFSNGDPVFGWFPDITMKSKQGALAQYVKVPVDCIALCPPDVTPVEAAGIMLAAQTAYHALCVQAELEPGQTVFINGGSSAVGAFAIQIAKAKGTKVVATASGKNEEFVRKMGADEFIDYTKVDLPKHLAKHAPTPKYHVILDAVGLSDPALYTRSESYLAPNGIFISSGASPSKPSVSEFWNVMKTIAAGLTPAWLGGVRRKYATIQIKQKPENLKAIQKLFADGAVKPIVDSVYDFGDVISAYDRMMSSRAVGKIVVKVDPSVV